jgi:hypothetical protein
LQPFGDLQVWTIFEGSFKSEKPLKNPWGLQICARSTTPRSFEKPENQECTLIDHLILEMLHASKNQVERHTRHNTLSLLQHNWQSM